MIGRLLGRAIGTLFGRSEPAPIAEALWQETLASLPFLAALDADEQQRLRALCEAFLGEKEFTAVGELPLTDALCVSIAAQGCLPILNLGLERYRGWVGIVVYADEFVIPRSIEDEFGVVHEYDEIASGEAWEGGPLLVSWRDAQMAGSGYNVVIHEFAHKLDMQNGPADGVPLLPPTLARDDWEATLLAAWENFAAEVDAADERGEDTALDPYAAESPAEFFAVMSEAFFETPWLLQERFPELYARFVAFYRQDPGRRPSPGA
ncbi:M90 family metallopeptidase [Rhodocyclus gracilis]|uniref:M90 family metallopeptidase n=1 Tax=Rhodocyclus gracilis TaxID=2929842 RepID=UPI0030F39F5F